MRMRDAARFFDRNPAYDGYTGAFLFNCVYSNFSDVAGDGSTNRRRALSTDPSVPVPARRCVLLGAERWLMGDPTDDSFEGTLTRHNYNVKRVTDLMKLLTPAQAAGGATTGTDAYASKLFFKAVTRTANSSEYENFWNVFLSPSEPAGKGTFMRDPRGVLFRVRQAYTTPEGFHIAETDELEADAYQAGVVFETGAYDPVTDKATAGTTTVGVVQMDPAIYYRFEVQAERDVKPGDKTVFTTLNAKPGSKFTMQGRKWQVVLSKPEGDAYALHARLA